MKNKKFEFEYEVYNDISELNKQDAELLTKARAVTGRLMHRIQIFLLVLLQELNNGEIVSGTNQENASYPVGICAERVLLGNAATLYPGVSIDTIAISYDSKEVKSDHPISPCGMCRQSLLEYETRTEKPYTFNSCRAGRKNNYCKNSELFIAICFYERRAIISL